VRVDSTNSGEGILERCEANSSFHGADLEGARNVVVDIARERWARRWRAVLLASLLMYQLTISIGSSLDVRLSNCRKNGRSKRQLYISFSVSEILRS